MDGFQSCGSPGPFDQRGSRLLISIGLPCTAHGREDIHDRPCRVLNQEGKKFGEETRLLCGLFEEVTEVLQGSFDGRHRLRPEASQPYSRMDRVCALRLVFWDCWRKKHSWGGDESEHPLEEEDNGTDQRHMYHGVVFRWFSLNYTKLAELCCRILEAMVNFIVSFSRNCCHKGCISIIYSTFVMMALKKMLQAMCSSCFSINSFYFRVFEAFKSKKEFIFVFHRLLYSSCSFSAVTVTLVDIITQKTLERNKSVWLPLHTCHHTTLLKVSIFLHFCSDD